MVENGLVLLLLFLGLGVFYEVGCMLELLMLVQGYFLVLGICLGYQVIVVYYGGKVGWVEDVMYGKLLVIIYIGEVMFVGLLQLLYVVCYYLLMVMELLDGLVFLVIVGIMVMVVYQV